MAWRRGIALGVVLIAGSIYWLGRRVPVEHRVVAKGIVAASQDRVWQLVDDTATQTQWRARLQRVGYVIGSMDGRCWIEVRDTGEITLCRVEEVPKSRLVVKTVGRKGYGGTWTYTLRPVGTKATEITVEEDGFVTNPLRRFVGYYLLGDETNVKQFVTDLQAEGPRKL